MPLPSFDYVRPHTLVEALRALADGDSRPLAGGQSLVSAMNLGWERPARIVDLNRTPGLAHLNEQGDWLRVGAMVRLATLRESDRIAARVPLLWAALRHVAHVQIRTRATIGGNLSQADPGSELPAVAVALGAVYTLRSSRGERTVPATEYATGPYLTSRHPDELLVEVSIPLHQGVVAGFFEVARKAKDWPILGAGAQLKVGGDGRIAQAWVGVCGAAARPLKLEKVEEALIGRRPVAAEFAEAAKLAAGAEEYEGARSGLAYRRYVLPTVVERALLEAVERIDRERTTNG